jgi:hypothetical protein
MPLQLTNKITLSVYFNGYLFWRALFVYKEMGNFFLLTTDLPMDYKLPMRFFSTTGIRS